MRMVAVAVVVMLAGCVTGQQQAMPSQFPEPAQVSVIRQQIITSHMQGRGMMQWVDKSEMSDLAIRNCMAREMVNAMTDREIAQYIAEPPNPTAIVMVYARVNPIATDECRR